MVAPSSESASPKASSCASLMTISLSTKTSTGIASECDDRSEVVQVVDVGAIRVELLPQVPVDAVADRFSLIWQQLQCLCCEWPAPSREGETQNYVARINP